MSPNHQYELYLVLFRSDAAPTAKQRSFEAACWGPHSWPVIEISEAAIELVRLSRNAKGTRRAHVFDRAERARRMFGRPANAPMGKDELLGFFAEHDKTTLVTAKEGARSGTTHWSKTCVVPSDLFLNGGFSVKIGPAELQWIDSQPQRIVPTLT